MSKKDRRIFPAILSGGIGSRLWPLSREALPKQFLKLAGDRTLLQQAAERVSGDRFGRIIVVANADHRLVIEEQLRGVGTQEPLIALEPVARNTAPAAAVAALLVEREDPDGLVMLMPADHAISNDDALERSLSAAAAAAEQGFMALFGIVPDSPKTGYGYIRTGSALDGLTGTRAVAAFVEKPDLATATDYVGSGDYLWNSGIFLMPAAILLAEMERHAPDILAAARAAMEGASRNGNFIHLALRPLADCRSVSIDHAVMEKTTRAAVVPAEFSWNDLGTWAELWDVSPKEEDGNVEIGPVFSLNTDASYLRSEGPVLATLGVEGLVVVATRDAVLVADRKSDRAMKALVEGLKTAGRLSGDEGGFVPRPWGGYRYLDEGEGFKVKRITVEPGQKLSLQKHRHRAEHWVVVKGTAVVVRDEERFTVPKGESVFLPLGCVHRLENEETEILELIEVQLGAYLEEDDIIRLEDMYSRI